LHWKPESKDEKLNRRRQRDIERDKEEYRSMRNWRVREREQKLGQRGQNAAKNQKMWTQAQSRPMMQIAEHIVCSK